MRSRATAIALTALLSLLPAAACDAEDRRDLREGVRDVEEGAEKAGEGAEDVIDEDIDTDGKDD